MWNVYRRIDGAGLYYPYTPAALKEPLSEAIKIAEKMVEWLYVGEKWHWETYPQEDPTRIGAILLDNGPSTVILVRPEGLCD